MEISNVSNGQITTITIRTTATTTATITHPHSCTHTHARTDHIAEREPLCVFVYVYVCFMSATRFACQLNPVEQMCMQKAQGNSYAYTLYITELHFATIEIHYNTSLRILSKVIILYKK